MLYEVIAFGSLWFWLFTALVVGGMFWQLDERHNPISGPLTVLLIALVFVTLFTDVPVWAWLKNNPYTALAYAGGYVLAGTLYSVVRWYFFCSDRAREYEKRRSDIQQSFNTHYSKSYTSFKAYAEDQGIFPMPSRNKALLTAWAMYWPVSAIWMLTHDIAYRIFRWIYDRMYSVYYRISVGVFSRRFSEFQ
jgi:hypothetical protein